MAARTARKVAHKFNIGEHVTWNSEAGRVRGRIVKVHTRNVDWHGYTHHASEIDPQRPITSPCTKVPR
jgi:hypothetical protein